MSIFIREGACKFLVKSLWCKFSQIMSDKISSKSASISTIPDAMSTRSIGTQTNEDFEGLDFSEDNTRRKSSRINSEDSHGVTNIVDATPWPDPEAILKKSSRKSEAEVESKLARQMKALEEKRAMESWKKPTDEMKLQKERMVMRQGMTRKERLDYTEDMHAANKILFEKIFPPI